MAITSYTDIISVERALNYLRQDDTMLPAIETQELESMITAAFLFMERYTSHIFMPKEFILYADYSDAWMKAHEFPIISVTPTDTVSKKKALYTNYNVLADTDVTYIAGYNDVTEIPADLIQAALQIIKVWYFESENQQGEMMIPISVRQVLDQYKRFV